MKKQYIISITFLFLFLVSFSQVGNVKGEIVNQNQSIWKNFRVVLGENQLETFVNVDGIFQFENLPYGNYNLKLLENNVEILSKTIIINKPTETIKLIIEKQDRNLDEVQIKGVRSSNDKDVEIGKIPIRAMDLPQSVMVIDKQLLDNQQVTSISDVLKNTNGVYIMGNSGGYQEEIAGRGFAFSSSNTFKNGVRFNNSIKPETSSLERVEVLKGSSAILFGQVAAGGVLNLVTKKPQFENGGSVGFRTGSYSMYKPTVDVYGSLNKKQTIAYRLNTTYENSKSFRDIVSANRIYFNPSLQYNLSKKIQILFEGDYLDDKRTADFGVGAINYSLINVPRNTFLGTKWGYMKTQQSSLTSTIKFIINKNWYLKGVGGFQDFSNELFATVRPNSSNKFIKEDGTWIRGIQRTTIDEKYGIGQLDLVGKFNTMGVKHTLLIGFDYDQYNTKTIAYNGITNYDTINVFNLANDNQRNDIPSLTEKTATFTPRERVGGYVQDLIGLGDKIKLLLGARISYLENESKVYTYSTDKTVKSKTFDHAISPRVGLVYQPIKNISTFVSYSNSFTPNTGVDINGKALEPSMIDQYELGVKNDLFNGILSFNVTAYQITNSNVSQMSLENGNTNSNIKELAGEIQSNGIEFDVVTKKWKGLNLIMGYSYNETKYLKSNIYIVGSRLLYNPLNTANLSVNYDFQNSIFKGFNIGLSSVYIGKRSAGRLTRLTVENDTYKPIPLPEYIQFDAMIGYTKNKITLNAKVSNVFNALSYNVHDDNSVNPIAPRMFLGSIIFNL